MTERVETDALYREQRPKLLRFLSRHAGTEQALDVVQNVFTRFLAGSLSTIKNPEAYLRRASVNQLRDQCRSDRRQSRDLHIPIDNVVTLAPDQIAAFEARDLIRRLDIVIGHLKPRTREIFLAHRVDGFSYREIAGRTGLSTKAVEKHMSKAIAHIDRHLGPL